MQRIGKWFMVYGSWVLLLCTMYYALCTAPPVVAETMQSNSYILRQGNLNMTSGLKSSSSYSLTDTVGQTAAEFFSSNGYHVKAGFQYMYTLYDFSFSISNLAIALGTLTPNTFATGSHTLTVTTPGQGYSVTAYEVNRLQNASNPLDFIADTTCNSGSCTDSSAGVWTTATNNGFGYNVTGDDKASDFTDSTYFRPFPDISLGDTPAVVMTSSNSGKNRTSTVTYQVSIPGSQAAGEYATQIVYIATPVY